MAVLFLRSFPKYQFPEYLQNTIMRKIIAVLFPVLITVLCITTINAKPLDQSEAVYLLAADKAVYQPGEPVWLSINRKPSSSFVRYRHLDKIIRQEALSKLSWAWRPPKTDYQGYLVEVYSIENGKEQVLAAIGIDISSSWNKFPRYGFLSEFGVKTEKGMDSVVNYLTRHHINGLQFYDWHDKHHQPLAGSTKTPLAAWKDIAGRDCRKETVLGYINRAHEKGMQAMFYNLCYGALDDAAKDGVSELWYMYRDSTHTKKDVFDLPQPPFKSKIWFTDPSNPSWQHYLSVRNEDVYKAYPFDGFHIDQVGNRDGKLYKYDGKVLDLAGSFKSFITAMKKAHPAKKLLFNAVNQYGQEGSIAVSPVDFLYTEVWSPNDGYKDLASIIQNNFLYSNGKATVLAAYMNYERASAKGYFNTAGVLLTNAVIFAFGGSHLELGEHMLCKEYFPNNNLAMSDELKKNITSYYDFLTAYQNLLRDGGSFNFPAVNCTNEKIIIGAWPPQRGKVSVQGKKLGSKQVLHLINFANAGSLDWRDTYGMQATPASFAGATIEVNYNGAATKVWLASPDINFGIPQQLSFTQTANTVKFTIPLLKFWDMIVIE